MSKTIFKCANPECENTIATEDLNAVQLKVLRRLAKTCDRCKQRTKWQEQVLLLNTNTNDSTYGGSDNATDIQHNKSLFDEG